MNNQDTLGNPRIDLLQREVERTVLTHFRLHSWTVNITSINPQDDCIEITGNKGSVSTKIAVLYSSSGISNTEYRELSKRVDHIFYNGQSYMLDSFTLGVTVPVEPLVDFFPFFVKLSKQVEPDRSPAVVSRKEVTIKRLTAENPLETVISRLQQFRSVKLAEKLVQRRAETEGVSLSHEATYSKATGIAYTVRNALDYLVSTSSDKLNRRIVSLYYGTIALAQAEMLASASGPNDLDQVEKMTKRGHGLYTLPGSNGGFADLHVGVRATGFLPEWVKVLGHDTTIYPQQGAKSLEKLGEYPPETFCSVRDLFASMPEIEDLFAEIFGGPPRWISVDYDHVSNPRLSSLYTTSKKTDSTYVLFIDRSGEISVDSLKSAGLPLAEIQRVNDYKNTGIAFRARVDHVGHDSWWSVLPTHSSPFVNGTTILFPTVGNLREYRTIAAVTLYALSIVVRYMPRAWWRIEGGDEDQYLALVTAALAVWERLLPEYFLESIAGEKVRTAQPGSFFA